jgi:glycosyltransferase involved in cell wall biosynthesis
MKVLHVINNLKREGAQKLLLDIITHDLNKDHELHLFLLESDNQFESLLKNHRNIKIVRIGVKKNSLKNFTDLFNIIREENYNVIHSHLFPSNYYCSIIKFLFPKKKFITTEHSTNNKRRNRLLFRVIETFLYSNYNVIICISEPAKTSLENHLYFSKNIITISNGINFNNVKIDSITNSKEIKYLKKLKNNYYLLFMIARFTPVKNHNIVINCLDKLNSDIHLVLIGDGIIINEIKTKVRQLKLDDRVHFMGSQENIFELLYYADISIIASKWEGFGLVAIESMACGVPTIVSNVMGLSNIVENGALKFDPQNSNELAEKIKLIKNSNNLKINLIKNGKDIAQKFNIEKTIKEYQIIYVANETI